MESYFYLTANTHTRHNEYISEPNYSFKIDWKHEGEHLSIDISLHEVEGDHDFEAQGPKLVSFRDLSSSAVRICIDRSPPFMTMSLTVHPDPRVKRQMLGG